MDKAGRRYGALDSARRPALPTAYHRTQKGDILTLRKQGTFSLCVDTLIVRMPELGTITREEASSLAGLAPLNKDSGKQEGERHIHGGRKRVRKAIFMAALASAMKWNPQLVDFYAKRKAKGMSHKPAIVACARKLLTMANAVLKRGTPWQKTREVMP
jgi:transposase